MLDINDIIRTYCLFNDGFMRLFIDNQISWIDVENDDFFIYGKKFEISYCRKNLNKKKFEYLIKKQKNEK